MKEMVDEYKRFRSQTNSTSLLRDKGEGMLTGEENKVKAPTQASYGDMLLGVGASAKQTVQSAYSKLYPNAKNKDLFGSIDEKEIENNMPLAKNVVEKNENLNPLNRSIFENLPYLKPGLATFYAAAFSGNYEAANAARKLAYTEDAGLSLTEVSRKEEENPSKVTNATKTNKREYNGWDAASDLLTLASLIPGVDTFADLASIPVDLIREDYFSAILSGIGALPFVGEVADAAKLVKSGDKIIDAIKGADKAVDAAKAADKAIDTAKATKATKKITSVADNAHSVAKEYNLVDGFFGEKGKNVRIFKSGDPIKTSADFYKKISKGGVGRILPNGKGVQTTFPDNSTVVYRVVTKTPDSPAIEITVEIPGMIKPQKIHFIKE